MKRIVVRTALFVILLSVAVTGVPAFAQQPEATKQEQEEEEEEEKKPDAVLTDEIVVTGTRKEGVAPEETLSPVDVLPATQITQQGDFDLTESIAQIAPSFNTQRFPIADGTAFIRPVTLRNLSPDHTLVLINGTRRHRSALVNLQLAPLGTVNQGAQAVDFSTIPAAAIKRIEVLRDGASAQYGSDAIAGVLNVILNDAAHGSTFVVQAGAYADGDGERTTVSGNMGFPLGPNGFLNATLEYSTSDKTSRGVARPDAAFVASVVGADQTPLNGLGQRWGDPEVEVWKLFLNSGIKVGDETHISASPTMRPSPTSFTAAPFSTPATGSTPAPPCSAMPTGTSAPIRRPRR